MWCIRLYLRDIFDTTPMGEVSEIESFLRFDGVPELSVTSRSSIFKYFRATAGVGPYSKVFSVIRSRTRIHVHQRKCYF